MPEGELPQIACVVGLAGPPGPGVRLPSAQARRDLVLAADQAARASIRQALRQANRGMADAFTRRREALTSAG